MLGAAMAEPLVPGNRVTLLHDGEQCLGAMLNAIEGAQTEILLEMYWFGSDRTGRRFAEALCERARAGVSVYVTYDAVGSLESSPAMFEAMRAAGCQVYCYNPIRFWHPRFRVGGINRRNHRKLLIVDQQIGMTGGVNLGDAWSAETEEGSRFRDEMIAIQGPVVGRMRDIFVETFEQGMDCTLPRTAPQPRSGNCGVRVLANDHRRQRRVIVQGYLAQMRRARKRILLVNSYFVPDRRVRRVLAQAVRRGVQVDVLLPLESDVPAVMYATRRLYGWMLKRGIRLYEWPQSILHSKVAVVDDDWCTVGTHNLDHRSWAYNLEINVVVSNAEVAQALRARLEQDLGIAVVVDARAWKYRPLSQRLLEWIFFRLRRLL